MIEKIIRYVLPILTLMTTAGLFVGILAAHDDLKMEEAGEPLSGSGHQGNPLIPNRRGKILGFPAANVTLLSWLTPEDILGLPTIANDIWGYVSPAGREYAIIGIEEGTAFVEITDPINPHVIDVIPAFISLWRDMAVFGEFAFSVNEIGNGLQVIDLRNIDQGEVRHQLNYGGRGLTTSHNISINPKSGYAYLSGSNLANGGLVAIDVSNPLDPRIEAVDWPFAYVHDALVITYEKGKYAGREIAFAFAGEDGVAIIDVTDKSDLFTIAEVAYPNLSYCHSGWLNKNNKFVYVNDELDERGDPDVQTTTTYIIKVKNLDNPKFIRAFSNGVNAIDHNTMTRGNRLYAANYQSGFRLFDIKNPRKPQEIGYFDTYPDSDEPTFSGAWGVFAGFPSGTVVVSDIQRGLFVLAVDD